MKSTAKVFSEAPADAEQQLARFIDKFDEKHAALIREVRRIVVLLRRYFA